MGTATHPTPEGNVAKPEEVSVAKKLGLREVEEIERDLAQASAMHLLGKLRGEDRPLPRRINDLLDERLAQQARIAAAE